MVMRGDSFRNATGVRADPTVYPGFSRASTGDTDSESLKPESDIPVSATRCTLPIGADGGAPRTATDPPRSMNWRSASCTFGGIAQRSQITMTPCSVSS